MRKVWCRKYKQEMDGLERAPYPSKQGEEIFNNVSKQAWQEWQTIQTMLINEHSLNLMEVKNREFVQQQMLLFFDNKDYVKPAHYKPLSS